MKKIFIFLIFLALTLSLFTACNNKKTTELKTGKYTLVLQDNNDISDTMLPCVTLTDEKFIFLYDSLNSYINIGTYIITDELLILTTCDEKYTYCFEIDRDSLFFIADKSDSVGLIDNKSGVQVLDGSEFKLTEYMQQN